MPLDNKKSIDLLCSIIAISNSNLPLADRLNQILDILCGSLIFESVALYTLDAEKERLYLAASRNMDYLAEIKISDSFAEQALIENRHIIFDNIAAGEGLFKDTDSPRPAGKGAVFPVSDGNFSYGLMIANLPAGQSLNDSDLHIIKTISSEVAGTIRNVQLYSNAKKVVEELHLINEVSESANSSNNIDELLQLTLNKLIEWFGVRCGIINITGDNGSSERTIFLSHQSELAQDNVIQHCKECGLDIHTIEEAVLLSLTGLSESAGTCPSEAVIAAPILNGDKRIGAIILFGKRGETPFTKEDLQLLRNLTAQVAPAIENTVLLEKTKVIGREREVMVQELSMLFDLNKAIMTTIDLDRLLHIILTAVTMGDGFGFNRAILFLYNKSTGYIQGMMGVGPDSSEAAGNIWHDIHEKGKTLNDIIEDEELKQPQSQLNELAKGMRVSESEKSILQLTVKEKKAFNISDAWSDPRVNRDLLTKLNCKAFATVPLMASGRVAGIILVDNIYNNRPIDDDDIRLLTIFANQAGTAIENSILYRDIQKAHKEVKAVQNKLIHSEKLAALGEMAAGIAHEIRNPLVSIGGFARRLARHTGENDRESGYVDIICKEVERLENILNDILVFSKEASVESGQQDINSLIEETLQFFWNDFEKCGIEVEQALSPDIGYVKTNRQQLKQVFINLFANAKHAMENGGKLNVKSYPSESEDKIYVHVDITDSGEGIPLDIINNIFNPFFTTKDSGIGLGLAITHKIISSYGGEIKVMNIKDGGATFSIRMPAVNQDDLL
ncbi:MAG: GAF domain-containing protein [Proteobacteria bacterium]|nr:GAF domain-containing protein [Pseudomonadota bacterium]